MLALFILPALLGLALSINLNDDNDDAAIPGEEVTPTPPVQTVTDGFIGADAAENLQLDDEGGNVRGGGGNDTIVGSDFNDVLRGGPGDDLMFARGGNDIVSGDAGNDRIFLGDGDDEYAPGGTAENLAGDDFVRGGDGRDVIIDLLGSNDLRGDLGRDTIIAFDGLSEIGNYDTPSELGTTDTLSGGFGADFLAGDGGDIMTGGAGFDTFIVTDDEDTDLAETRITDFNTLEDSLVIVQLDGLSNADEVSFDVDPAGVRVFYEGRAVAFLEGLGSGSIPNIDVSLTRIEALGDEVFSA